MTKNIPLLGVDDEVAEQRAILFELIDHYEETLRQREAAIVELDEQLTAVAHERAELNASLAQYRKVLDPVRRTIAWRVVRRVMQRSARKKAAREAAN